MILSLAINADDLNLDDQKMKKLKNSLSITELNHRWIPKNRLHIQLLSLGVTTKEKLDELKIRISNILQKHNSFEVKLNGIWAYPNQKEGRLLWIGVQNSVPLRALQDNLARSLIGANTFRDEKVFRPILPIVRLKNHHDVTDMISPYKTSEFGKLKVNTVTLYDMVLGGAFPVYEIVESFTLSGHSARTESSKNLESDP